MPFLSLETLCAAMDPAALIEMVIAATFKVSPRLVPGVVASLTRVLLQHQPVADPAEPQLADPVLVAQLHEVPLHRQRRQRSSKQRKNAQEDVADISSKPTAPSVRVKPADKKIAVETQ